jgi:hypothetical protein
MDIVPDTGQLSQVMVQATAPAFILGAVAGFISILLGRMTSVIDCVRSLNEIADGDTARAHLRSDIPRLRKRAKLLNGATRLALASGMCTSLLLVVDLGARSSGCSTYTEPVSFLLSRSPCWEGRSSDSVRR